MQSALLAVTAAALSVAGNVAVQLFLRFQDGRRGRRVAARTLLAEFGDVASACINTTEGKADPQPLVDAWRAHRGSLSELGADEWEAIDTAVRWCAHPEEFPPDVPRSDPLWRIELASIIVERYAAIPSDARRFGL